MILMTIAGNHMHQRVEKQYDFILVDLPRGGQPCDRRAIKGSAPGVHCVRTGVDFAEGGAVAANRAGILWGGRRKDLRFGQPMGITSPEARRYCSGGRSPHDRGSPQRL